jgi:2-(1,2-epoxy-1,2-dihydrophenyl)acetyl-CoA isomerase
MKTTNVAYSRSGGVSRILLSRPHAANAFDVTMAREMQTCVDLARKDSSSVVLLTAEGSRFCGGGDIRAIAAANDPAAYISELASTLEEALHDLSEMAKPVVVAVQGSVAGAGLALVFNSDLVLAATTATFTFAYGAVGLTPDCGVSYLLPRAIGQQRALEFALSGRSIDAGLAQTWGLVGSIEHPADLDAAAESAATALADLPALASSGAKRLLRDSWAVDRRVSARCEIAAISAAVNDPEARTRIHRFLAN